MNTELAFVSGNFFDYVLPKEKLFLYKYFTSEPQRQFVRYFLIFREIRYFVDRTGCYISKPWLIKLRDKLNGLELAHAEARKNLDFELIGEIELGNFKVTSI